MKRSAPHPGPWTLRPGDLPARAAIESHRALADLSNNALFRYLTAKRRRHGPASLAREIGRQGLQVTHETAVAPLLAGCGLAIGAVSIVAGATAFMTLGVWIFSLLTRGLNLSADAAAAIVIFGTPIALMTGLAALVRFRQRRERARAASPAPEVHPQASPRGIGPIPASILEDLRVTPVTPRDVALALWGGRIGQQMIRRGVYLLSAGWLGATLLGIATDRGLSFMGGLELLVIPFIAAILAERIASQLAAAPYNELDRLTRGLASLRRRENRTLERATGIHLRWIAQTLPCALWIVITVALQAYGIGTLPAIAAISLLAGIAGALGGRGRRRETAARFDDLVDDLRHRMNPEGTARP